MVTISGPPTTLQALFQDSEYFRERKTRPLDIFGPFHASHLYSEVDVEEVVQPITETNVKLGSPSIRVISGISETALPDVGIYQSLRQVVGAVLVRPLSFDHILTEIVSAARDSGRPKCRISSVGPSYASSSLSSALKVGTEVEVSIGE